MTGGSKIDGNNGTSGVGAPTPALQPRDDRETLSALFDGELPGDATRFALKRLEHDVQWQDTCGRWQMLGDVLRGESAAAAPVHFADGVVRALGQLPPAQVQVATPVARGVVPARGRWWGGAALAASLALAAVLVVKPFSTPSGPQPPPAVAQQPAAPALPVVSASVPVTAGGEDAVVAVAPAEPAPARLAVSQSPARRAVTRPRRSATGAVQPPAPAEAIVAAAPVPAQPFHPPSEEVGTRPWPRAVLPNSAAAGAFTVGLGGSTPSPSFYPFEPQVTQPPTQDEDLPSP